MTHLRKSKGHNSLVLPTTPLHPPKNPHGFLFILAFLSTRKAMWERERMLISSSSFPFSYCNLIWKSKESFLNENQLCFQNDLSMFSPPLTLALCLSLFGVGKVFRFWVSYLRSNYEELEAQSLKAKINHTWYGHSPQGKMEGYRLILGIIFIL